ncbi:MAG: transposase [Candidatus Omnitrophica bacterium]|nr:transposase [Candidatus Omnitrophota bacterium]
MARRPRTQFPDARFHIFNRGVNRCLIYHDDQDRRVFLKILHSALMEFGLTLYAYCLMSNHYHLFMRISSANLNKSMQKMQSRYATYFNSRHDRVGYLFQGRYKSRLVENDSYSLAVVRYIHQNPSEIDKTKPPETYPWSSYPDYVQETQPQLKLLNTDWILSQFHEDSKKARLLFKKFHNARVPEGSEASDPYDPN